MTTIHDGSLSDSVAEADVELNAVAFDWSSTPASNVNARPVVPLVPLLIHEIGHILGFEDTCGSRHDAHHSTQCSRDELASVMLSGSGREQLTAWDVERLCARFPRKPESPSDATDREEGRSVDAPLGWVTLGIATVLVIAFLSSRYAR